MLHFKMKCLLCVSVYLIQICLRSQAHIWKPRGSLIDSVLVTCVSSDYGSRNKRSAVEIRMPVKIHFRFTSRGKEVNLRLKRSSRNQAADIPVYVIKDSHIVREDLPPITKTVSYLDKVLGATVMVKKETGGNFTMTGTYFDGVHMVYVQPNSPSTHELLAVGGINYGQDFLILQENTALNPNKTSWTRLHRRSVDVYTIEILFCSDYKDFSNWLGHFSNSTIAKREMQLFYSFIAQSMALRYDSVADVDPTMKINIHITGLLLADAPEKSPWTENEASPDGVVEVKPALKSFRNWVHEQTQLPSSDHWMLFSGYELSSNKSKAAAEQDDRPNKIFAYSAAMHWNKLPNQQGLAPLATMCTSSSVSIIEQDYSASVGAIAAHELGHSLSAVHDGTLQAVGCPDSDLYIMSIRLVIPPDNETASRPWEFSRCSVAAFKTYLARVYCARDGSIDNTQADTQLNPGQLYTSDVQCRLALGNQSYFGRAIQHASGFDNMCRAMYCGVPNKPRMFARVIPMEMTTCGDGKWCVKGRCLSDVKAPRTPKNCPQGDAPRGRCHAEDCPFLTQKWRISYCCSTCGVIYPSSVQLLKPSTAHPWWRPITPSQPFLNPRNGQPSHWLSPNHISDSFQPRHPSPSFTTAKPDSRPILRGQWGLEDRFPGLLSQLRKLLGGGGYWNITRFNNTAFRVSVNVKPSGLVSSHRMSDSINTNRQHGNSVVNNADNRGWAQRFLNFENTPELSSGFHDARGFTNLFQKSMSSTFSEVSNTDSFSNSHRERKVLIDNRRPSQHDNGHWITNSGRPSFNRNLNYPNFMRDAHPGIVPNLFPLGISKEPLWASRLYSASGSTFHTPQRAQRWYFHRRRVPEGSSGSPVSQRDLGFGLETRSSIRSHRCPSCPVDWTAVPQISQQTEQPVQHTKQRTGTHWFQDRNTEPEIIIRNNNNNNGFRNIYIG